MDPKYERKNSIFDDDDSDNLGPKNNDIYYSNPKRNLESSEKLRFRSLIAIGNPIVDISSNIDKTDIDKFGLKWGETVFANDSNRGFFKELEKKKMLNTSQVAQFRILYELHLGA